MGSLILLTALGFLGLLGILVLILIYILKPNYIQKFISSTHVWRLSLKYKKRRIPISRIRNIIIFICQVLIITVCSFILTQPHILAPTAEQFPEKIAIIDASAGMQAINENGETRFNRAIAQVESLGRQTIGQGGLITVIVANQAADTVVARTSSLDSLSYALSDIKCTMGVANIEDAMKRAEVVLNANPFAEVILYTSQKYANKGNVTVVEVADKKEWNAAIIDCTAEINPDNNYYIFSATVASYNNDTEFEVYIEINGVNFDSKRTVEAQQSVRLFDNEEIVILFESLKIYSFENLRVDIRVDDSFSYDNVFYIYGGVKETIRVLYYSTNHNPFFQTAFAVVREMFADRWNIEIYEITPEDEYELTGYDFYLFEHEMPMNVPTDGIVLLVNPDRIPENFGIILGIEEHKPPGSGDNFKLSAGESHPIANQIVAERIEVSRYRKIIEHTGFTPILYSGGDPVFLIKDEEEVKAGLISFSVHASTFAVSMDLPIIIHNMFEYFLPATLKDGHIYDVDESIRIDARSSSVDIIGPGLMGNYDSLPCEISAPFPGQYSIRQTPLSGKPVTDRFYVKVAASESNFAQTRPQLVNPFWPARPQPEPWDLLLYFAIALVVLIISERFLYGREQI